ncbi:E3 ubiquitin-protein ligase TRAIP isoform X2 [Hydra vulgaris]|uniref:E3 ubiquitin-protein ligase TRAIP isoform X2 n=1 Tax=Hydra vulgaris TaxID=6087 RepID=A0ABM4C3P8_HYDVU
MNRSTCTICSDLLTLTDVAACLCGHTFHYHCLVAWKECSPTCPQCRHKFTTPIKLFFDLAVTDDSNVDVSTLKVQMDDLKINLTLKEQECSKIKEKQLSYEKEIDSLTHELQSMSELLQNAQGHNSILKKQISYLEKVQSDYEKSKAEVISLEKKLNSFANINVLVKADRQEVESILKNCADSSESLIQIKTSYIILKNAFDKLQDTKNKLEAEKKQLKRHIETLERECREHRGKVDSLTTDVTHLNEINKKLMEKVQNLECSFNISSPFIQPSKKSIAESSKPVIKRSRFYDEGFNDKNTTIELFDDSSDLASCFHENDDIEIAELYGLKNVATTNMAEQRVPLRDIKSSKFNIKLHTQATSSNGHLMPQGFNGMGGQSRVLVLPKKSFSTIAKTSAAIKNARKLPKSKSKHNLKETKIPDFLGSPITLSP